ncbi:UDP-N-acetylmuramate dehydrogenase [Myxococcota bacterium]|nr:UDP-N-acetylmuramate dehydrogenase [Myxococcota bacterium]MBU1535937.1 UDP-N-acetylmuramate dehydrogenase [Myxococcota bacterium]
MSNTPSPFAGLKELLENENILVVSDYPLGRNTTYGLGGTAALAVFPENPDQLGAALAMVVRQGLTPDIFGGGSNVLVADCGSTRPTIVLNRMTHIGFSQDRVSADAGVPSSAIAAGALAHSLTGAEFLTDLPGSIGGAAYMNARAFGSEMSQILVSARVVDPLGNVSTLAFTPADFAYKRSPFREKALIVAQVTLALSAGDEATIAAAMEANAAHRRKNEEDKWPSCGCVFKNPMAYGQSAGKIIDDLGLKGFGTDNAWVHRQHANFVVHNGKASSTEVRWVMEQVRQRVLDERGVALEFEVEFEGDWEST